ncbi:MAG: response regulator, partial [Kiritimatiellae bacterium]|nr:response regulator [Kiritimatiellia bacterium]
SDTVDAILLDLNLPDGSGIDWAEKLQALKADVPVIFFTGANHTTSMKMQDAHRFFLKKPFAPAAMSEVLVKATGNA